MTPRASVPGRRAGEGVLSTPHHAVFDYNHATPDEIRREAERRAALRAEGRSVVADSEAKEGDGGPGAERQGPSGSSAAAKMNKTERRYADILEARKRNGEIVDYVFGAVTLKLGADLRYTPDFLVVLNQSDCTDAPVFEDAPIMELHEVKGKHEREDARVKRLSAATQFPWFTFRLAKYEAGQWTITEMKTR